MQSRLIVAMVVQVTMLLAALNAHGQSPPASVPAATRPAADADGWQVVLDLDLTRADALAGWTVKKGKWEASEAGLRKVGLEAEGMLTLREPVVRGAMKVEYEAKSDEPADLSLLMGQADDTLAGAWFAGFGTFRNAYNKLMMHNRIERKSKGPLIEKGKWHRVALLREAGEVRMLIDGEETLRCPDAQDGLAGPYLSFYVYNEGVFRRLRVSRKEEPRLTAWRGMESVEQVCAVYPREVAVMLAALDLGRKGLEAVKVAVGKDDSVAACKALLEYYSHVEPCPQWRRHAAAATQPALRPPTEEERLALDDTFSLYDQTARVPRNERGGLSWQYCGPTYDGQWAGALNRHPMMSILYWGYVQTGQAAFGEKLDEDLRDWLTASRPCPVESVDVGGGYIWGPLEAGLRVKNWPFIFHGLRDDPRLRPATRVLMLMAVPEHAEFLRKNPGGGNWTTMTMSGLGTLAASWPEFKQSAAWMDFAKRTLTTELGHQVYEDGVQKELASHYHWVALSNFNQLAEICRNANEPLPPVYAQGLERMYNYLAYSLMPNGFNPLNNDSDHIDHRATIRKAAEQFHRPDWTYIASGGAEGQRPQGEPSAMFPWAGQLISRNGWDADAQWSFFDVGPWGAGHQHDDMLHLSVHAFGRDLLVDTGRFSYSGAVGDKFRYWYALRSQAHNVLLIDGAGQNEGPLEAKKPLDETDYAITPAWDFARGTHAAFRKIPGKAAHTRALLYLRGQGWLVVDRVETDRPRDVSALWHFHPQCMVSVEKDGSIATGDADKGNLRITPAGPVKWTTQIVAGQEKPLQGWYSERYNDVQKSPTAVCLGRIEKTATFAWFISCAKGPAPAATVELSEGDADVVHVKLNVGARSREIAVPVKSNGPVKTAVVVK
ncbi:MAG: alginate lyase family protein [Planctomycetota bacterium]|nr:alginate lyase family protein [Planctomycetota bacterium]